MQGKMFTFETDLENPVSLNEQKVTFQILNKT